jgi:hypothetical protein
MTMGRIGLLLAASLAALAPVAAGAQAVAPPPVRATVTAAPRTILFIGNSFTQGAHSAVRNYRADSVTDLNHDGYGGVPALFKLFAEESGQAWQVSLETQGGKGLDFHYDTRRALFDRPWDVVMLQDFSTLDREHPGDPALHVRYAGLLASLLRARNPQVRIELTATWSRADLTYKPKGAWYGKPITAMATDLRAASNLALASSKQIEGVVPVGEAWNRAFADGVADPNPYDGTAFGQVDLWSYDQYHASIAGYYLEALTIFGKVTGVDPRSLGATERAADELGLSPELAVTLQGVAFRQLEAERTGRR